jgi:thiol-disulfide isomerase/thioredoxin
VRSDSNLKRELGKEKGGDYEGLPGIIDTEARNEAGERILRSHSMSGSEPNSFFYNAGARKFHDWSAVSGLDHIADGRSFAYFDYDRDGWIDIALVNSNNPQLVLYRNQLGERHEGRLNYIAVQLHGGNRSAQPAPGLSNRDGFGAQILVNAGESKLHREVRCGDGFAAQNSRVTLIGIGNHKNASVSVVWPSGKESRILSVAAGSLVTFDETGVARVTPYRKELTREPAEVDRGTPLEFASLAPSGKPRVLITMATWCEACKAAQPQVTHLVAQWPDLNFVGVPVDEKDTTAKLSDYESKQKPAYHLAKEIAPADRDLVARLLEARLGEAALPSTIVVDEEGYVRGVFAGVPGASEIGKALAE